MAPVIVAASEAKMIMQIENHFPKQNLMIFLTHLNCIF